jgi:membrane-associated phospholipid phosphatase
VVICSQTRNLGRRGPRRFPRLAAAALFGWAALAGDVVGAQGTPAAAAPPAFALPAAAPVPAPAPVPATMPLAHEFSATETTVAIGVAAAGVFLLAAGSTVFDPPRPSMGPPDPESIDARVARWLYQSSGERFLGGVPDIIGIAVVPVVPLLLYGMDSVSLLRTGRPWLRQGDLNPHHHLLAYVEAVGWTLLVTGVVKYVAGRPRPYTEGSLNHPQLRRRDAEDNLSFFSAHAAVDFAVGAFVTADVSRALLRGPLADARPVPRFLLGSFLPALVGYGVPTLVGISRVIDQQHWPSDVIAGAMTGALISHLVYATHFDSEGRPRGRHALAPTPLIATQPLLGATFGVGLSGRF